MGGAETLGAGMAFIVVGLVVYVAWKILKFIFWG